MVEVTPERLGVELVDKLLTRRDKLEHPAHARRVEAVEVDRVRVSVPVSEYHPQQVTLPGAQRGPGYLPVVGPRRIHHPRRHLYFHRLRTQLVLSNRPAALGPLLTPVEVPQERRGIEPREVHIPNRPVPPVRSHAAGVCSPVARPMVRSMPFSALPEGSAGPQQTTGNP